VSELHPRDRAIEALLRRQQLDGIRTAACLDPEVLAGWADNSLDATTRAQAEAHLADCGHCQAVMAAMVRSEPAREARVPWWSRLHMRWLVPLTAAAAATVLWVATGPGGPAGREPVSLESTTARDSNRSRPEQEAVSPPAASTPVPQSTPTPAEPPARTGAASSPDADARGNRARPGERLEQRSRVEAPAEALEDRQSLAKEVPSPGAGIDPTASQAGRAEQKGSPAPPRPADAEPPPAPRQDAPASGAAARLGRAAGTGAFDSAGTGTITSRDATATWRLAGPGIVERSMDRGATWQRIDTGIARVFTSGFAPDRTVCWLIGPGSLIAVTGDGVTWRQLPPPDGAAELASIVADDERTATVRDVEGRAFRTTDGGATWVSTP
jgi:hypothetical protein